MPERCSRKCAFQMRLSIIVKIVHGNVNFACDIQPQAEPKPATRVCARSRGIRGGGVGERNTGVRHRRSSSGLAGTTARGALSGTGGALRSDGRGGESRRGARPAARLGAAVSRARGEPRSEDSPEGALAARRPQIAKIPPDARMPRESGTSPSGCLFQRHGGPVPQGRELASARR